MTWQVIERSGERFRYRPAQDPASRYGFELQEWLRSRWETSLIRNAPEWVRVALGVGLEKQYRLAWVDENGERQYGAWRNKKQTDVDYGEFILYNPRLYCWIEEGRGA
jgi:hypothetical protein